VVTVQLIIDPINGFACSVGGRTIANPQPLTVAFAGTPGRLITSNILIATSPS
jgi:hypothetical protein